MKRLITLILTLVLFVSCAMMTACNGKTLTIKKAYVNNENHIIVEYSDGTIEDLGYVDVSVGGGQTSTNVYVVTFVDVDGNELSKQQVYEGLSAFAPEAPSIKNKVFAGWSKDFTNVKSNLTVQATYTNGQTYTVKFVDANGNELKTQEVFAGESATAPTAPTVEGKVFNGWDKSFTNVNSNLTVQATYREAGDCVVTFKDYSGITLGTVNVKEGGNVTAPVTPSREGYSFTGWSSSLNNITSNKTVTAEYTLNSGNNIFDIAYKVNDNNVTVTLSLAGTVCLAGFEGTLSFAGMNVVNATAKSTYALINTSGNSVKMTYSNATNVTKGEVVLEVTLTKTADNGTATLNLTDCFDQNFATVNYKVIGQNIKLK